MRNHAWLGEQAYSRSRVILLMNIVEFFGLLKILDSFSLKVLVKHEGVSLMLNFCVRSLGTVLLISGATVMAGTSAEQKKVEVLTLLKATHSWDGGRYLKYPEGQPEVSILRYKVAPNTELPWHSHPVINAAYVISGHITVTRKKDGKAIVIGPGDVLPEMVGTLHRGQTGDETVDLIVFYAGTPSLPLVVKPGA
ncbi:cupin domain-containing protein [Pseudomonas marginalis]